MSSAFDVFEGPLGIMLTALILLCSGVLCIG